MFSVSPAEVVTIALVALIVFGPKRLPEISRKAGKVLRELRETAGELKADLEVDYDVNFSALDDVRREMRATLDAVGGLAKPDPLGRSPRTPTTDPTAPPDDENAARSTDE